MLGERLIPWNELGTNISQAKSIEEAMSIAKLNWEVNQTELIYNGKNTGYMMNIRDIDDTVLGVVGGRYKPVQNVDAFAFVDELIDEGLTFQMAGGTPNGKRIYLLAKMPERSVLGDSMEPYMCISNSHDGFGSLKVFMTPIRVACNNMINLALSRSTRVWSLRHTTSISGKLHEAQLTMFNNNRYMEELQIEAEELAAIKISPARLELLINTLIPITSDMGARKETTQVELRETLHQAWNMDDLGNIRGTGWGFINAVSDMVTHRQASRSNPENMFLRNVDEPILLNDAYKLLRSVA